MMLAELRTQLKTTHLFLKLLSWTLLQGKFLPTPTI